VVLAGRSSRHVSAWRMPLIRGTEQHVVRAFLSPREVGALRRQQVLPPKASCSRAHPAQVQPIAVVGKGIAEVRPYRDRPRPLFAICWRRVSCGLSASPGPGPGNSKPARIAMMAMTDQQLDERKGWWARARGRRVRNRAFMTPSIPQKPGTKSRKCDHSLSAPAKRRLRARPGHYELRQVPGATVECLRKTVACRRQHGPRAMAQDAVPSPAPRRL